MPVVTGCRLSMGFGTETEQSIASVPLYGIGTRLNVIEKITDLAPPTQCRVAVQ